MRSIDLFFYEWKHFSRSPFKIVALLLFTLAGIYGLNSGSKLYENQKSEITSINLKVSEKQEETISYYTKGEKGPKDRSWVDLTTPFWATWYVPTYKFKTPSPLIVYGIGQAEQYGFYKQITIWSSPSDSDMVEEIANPERLQIGTLDFSFVIIFLLPLLLLILLHNLKSAETEQGYLMLINVQARNITSWLFIRTIFYVLLISIVCLLLMIYGASLTNILGKHTDGFFQLYSILLLYLLLWTIIYFIVINKGKTSAENTLKMIGIWLVLAFVIPGTIHLWVSIKSPTNLMLDLIDAQRDEFDKISLQPDSVIDRQLYILFPEIELSETANDSLKKANSKMQSGSALANELIKKTIHSIELENQQKNDLIRNTYWLNPIAFFQNKFNSISETSYQDYHQYRQEIQQSIDRRIKIMVVDIWKDVKVDKKQYLEYSKTLNSQ